MPINCWPRSERPREKLLERGPVSLSDAELLAIFLRVGTQGFSAVDMGREMLTRFGSLRALLDTPVEELLQVQGLGPARVAGFLAAMELGKRYLAEELVRAESLERPEQAGDYLRAKLRQYPHEVFACLYLDNRHRVLHFEELFNGTIDGAAVYPREVVRKCLKNNAAAVIFAHNHPSGVAEPSEADKSITRRLRDALSLVDVRVLDHLVIGDSGWVSLAQRGCI